MKYTLSVTIAGLFLLVPDEDLKVLHVLFPRGLGSGHGGHSGDAGGHEHGAPAAAHSMPPHDILLVHEADRDLPPVVLNDRDVDLSSLNRQTDLPGIPSEVFTLRGAEGDIKGARTRARAAMADRYLLGRLTLRGGRIDTLKKSKFLMPDGSTRLLAGIVEWSVSLSGDAFPGAVLMSLSRGAHAYLSPLSPIVRAFDDRTVRLGVVHTPEQFQVRTVEDIMSQQGEYDAEHIEMLYEVVGNVRDPVIPSPVNTADPSASSGGPTVRYPTRCVSARTLG